MQQKKLQSKGTWRTLSSKKIYRNPWIIVREDAIIHPNGKKGIYGVVEIPPGIFVIAQNSDKKILLIKQSRYPTGITSWELPGDGLKVDRTKKQQALEELQEEALMSAQSFKPLGKTQTQPGITDEIDYFFLATNLTVSGLKERGRAPLEEGVFGRAFFTHTQIRKMIARGSISHAQTITGYFLLLLYDSNDFMQNKK